MSILEIILEVVVGLVVPWIAFDIHLAKKDEIKEIVFLEIAAAVLLPVLILIFRMIFIAPYKIYQEQSEEIAALKNELNKQSAAIKPLEIEAIPPTKIRHTGGYWQYKAEFYVKNENQAVGGVKLKLLKIEPPFNAVNTQSNYLSEISRFDLPLNEPSQNTLNQGEKIAVPVFAVMRNPGSVTLEAYNQHENQILSPQYKNNKSEHILTFETSAVGVPTHESKFKIAFFKVGDDTPFTLEKK